MKTTIIYMQNGVTVREFETNLNESCQFRKEAEDLYANCEITGILIEALPGTKVSNIFKHTNGPPSKIIFYLK